MMILAGIDYSMTSPAICIYDSSKPLTFENLFFYNRNDIKKVQGVKGNVHIEPHEVWDKIPELRYRQIAAWAVDKLVKHKVDLVSLEGYSMGSSSGLVFNIAENTSVLKQMMFDKGLKFVSNSPSSVKKNFQGKGNAKKDQMCEEFYKRLGVKPFEIFGGKQYDAPENDLVDSFANMLMGMGL